MCKKAVDNCPFMLECVPNWYKTQEMCEKAVSKESFMLKYCFDKYKSQETYKEAFNACLPLLKLLPGLFVTNKMLKVLDNAVFLITI